MSKIQKIFSKRKDRSRWNLKSVNKTNRPRLSIYRSNMHIYAQVIDDIKGVTLCAFSTKSKDFKEVKTSNIPAASIVGENIARLAIEKKIKDVVFDRGAYYYHGRVKALADGARKGGLNF